MIGPDDTTVLLIQVDHSQRDRLVIGPTSHCVFSYPLPCYCFHPAVDPLTLTETREISAGASFSETLLLLSALTGSIDTSILTATMAYFTFIPSNEGLRAIVAGWSSPVAREAHNLEVAGSNPVPAT